MAPEYAVDESNAEKARVGSGAQADSQLHPSGIERATNGARILDDHGENNELDFRPDAKVWHLYLTEAEREAKERAELWRTGLDAVLIFAGLFAGIVSAFVIDVRKDLEADSEQRLLANIDRILREQQPLSNRVPPISIAMSGLWNISLYITLFAAMMGASAKAWLAAFIPVNTPHEAKGAFHRYRLDQHAERWCLQEVIASAPLLIQFALGLFLVGLILQNFIDNWVLGVLILLFFVSGGILYFLLTIHPWGTPSSPYNTAISGPLMWLALGLPSRGKKNPPDVEMDINKGLADILYTRLLKSPNPVFVDEAIAEIALPGFKQKWIDYLCRKDTPLVVLKRLRQGMADGQMASEKNSCAFYNILVVFLRFLGHYEVETASRVVEGHSPEDAYRNLTDALCQLSVFKQHNHHLSQPRSISEDVDILLLSLSIHLDCRTFRCKAVRNLSPPRIPEWCGLRWDAVVLSDWASEASHLKHAACRAVIMDHPGHIMTSARLLISSLVSVATRSSRGSTHAPRRHALESSHWPDGCLSMALKCLAKLYGTAVAEWKGKPYTPYIGQSSGSKEQRRYSRRRTSRSATLSIDTAKPSECVASTFSMLAEEEEDPQIRSVLQHFARGQTSRATKAVVQGAIQSLCATIHDSYPEDRAVVTNALAFLYSKNQEIFEELEDISTLRDILPMILHDLAGDTMGDSPETQTLLLALLSAMARNPEARRDIILHLLDVDFKSAAQQTRESNLELLIRLLIDGRLAHEPTDFLMLASASRSALEIPQLGPYRARISDALRSKYASTTFELDVIKHKELSSWFLLAVLGQRATMQEVSSWVARCQLWLAEGRAVSESDCTTGEPD